MAAKPSKSSSKASSSAEAAYVPLARKYRPQTFDELTGQAHVTTTLARAIESNRVGQAYLFAGQRGVGKTSAARILARCLNCVNGPTATPCQRCPSCDAMRRGTSLDVIEIDGASNRGIDDIRQLREQVKLAPVLGAYRIYIIDEVHQITPDAFNALLKTLEEPPPHVKFIFATTAPQKVPATILSRCQRFDFRRVDVAAIAATLARVAKTEHVALDEAASYAIARAADGSVRDAEVLLDQLASFCDNTIREPDVVEFLGSVEQDTLITWTQALVTHDAVAALTILTQQRQRGKDVLQLLMDLLAHLRHLLLVRLLADSTMSEEERTRLRRDLIDVPQEQVPALAQQAAQLRPEEWMLITQMFAGAYEMSRRSPFAETMVELALIQVATRESWASVNELIQRLERLAASPSPDRSRSAPAPALSPEPAPRPPHPSASSTEKPSSGRLELDALSTRWAAVLEQIGKQKMSLAAYLAQARPIEAASGRVQIGLPGFALHHEVLTLVDNLRMVEQAIREVTGQTVTVHYVRLPDPPPGQPAAALGIGPGATAEASVATTPEMPPIVQDIVSLFDAKVVSPPTPRVGS